MNRSGTGTSAWSNNADGSHSMACNSASGDTAVVCNKIFRKLLIHIRFDSVIAVNEPQQFAASDRNTRISCITKTTIIFMDHLNAAILSGPIVAHCRAVIGRSVIYQDNFQVGVDLICDKPDAFVQVFFNLIYWDNCTD